MKFILLSLNMIIIVALGVYLLNSFNINEFGINGIGFVILSGLAITLFADYLIKENGIKNPLFFILPGLAAVLISVLAIRGLSFISIAGILFTVPGLTMLIIKNKERPQENKE